MSVSPDTQHTEPNEDDLRFAASLIGWTVDKLRQVNETGAEPGDDRMVRTTANTIARRLAWERASALAECASAVEPSESDLALAERIIDESDADYGTYPNLGREFAQALASQRAELQAVADQRHCATCECMCHCGYVIDSLACVDWHTKYPHTKYGIKP